MNLRGSLNLSINAIVVLILAITMLGLGLGFVRNMFGETTSQFSEVSEGIKDQLMKDMQESKQKLTFLKNEITVESGDEISLYFGLHNNLASAATFFIVADCQQALDKSAKDELGESSFNTFTRISIDKDESRVSKIILDIKASSASTSHSCFLKIFSRAALTNEEGMCIDLTNPPSSVSSSEIQSPVPACTNPEYPLYLYDKKNFYVKIK